MKMKYDTSTLEGKIAVMREFERTGKRPLHNDGLKWRDTISGSPSWCWGNIDYNYPAEPELSVLVPWTFETCPKGVVLLKYAVGFGMGIDMIVSWVNDGVLVTAFPRGNNPHVSWEKLLVYATHSLDNGRTWLPCGTEEKR